MLMNTFCGQLLAMTILNDLWIFVAHNVEGGHKARPYHLFVFFGLGLLAMAMV